MKDKSLMTCSTSNPIVENAVRNYETYVKHYKSRNFIPMSLNDFLKNYSSI